MILVKILFSRNFELELRFFFSMVCIHIVNTVTEEILFVSRFEIKVVSKGFFSSELRTLVNRLNLKFTYDFLVLIKPVVLRSTFIC
jgi:hypothetical protein